MEALPGTFTRKLHLESVAPLSGAFIWNLYFGNLRGTFVWNLQTLKCGSFITSLYVEPPETFQLYWQDPVRFSFAREKNSSCSATKSAACLPEWRRRPVDLMKNLWTHFPQPPKPASVNLLRIMNYINMNIYIYGHLFLLLRAFIKDSPWLWPKRAGFKPSTPLFPLPFFTLLSPTICMVSSSVVMSSFPRTTLLLSR